MPQSISQAHIDTANKHLNTIEHEYDVTVVLAVAHGSHAWGLSNSTSDYDIKAVYAPNNTHQYAHLGSHRETITRDFGNYEIEAWDVKKLAELLYKSNDQAIDLLRSPIAYRERVDRQQIREYIEEHYNPIQLYHTYRSISKNNYRKYLSHHLTSNRNNTYPILERIDETPFNTGGYLVLNEYTDTRLFVPDRVIDTDDKFMDVPFENVDTTNNDHRYCPNCNREPDVLPTNFQTTQTRQTVKRNLAVIRAVMHARYLQYTGEHGTHELPNVDFPVFLSEQAPVVFDQDIIDIAHELVTLKRNGDNINVGDRVGRAFSHPPEEISPETHATSPPHQDRINEYVSKLLNAA